MFRSMVTIALLTSLLLLAGLSTTSAAEWQDIDLGYYNLPQFEELTGSQITAFSESPLLTERVQSGQLPPVSERLPSVPLVQIPWDTIGEYGGTLRWDEVRPDYDIYLRYLNTSYLMRTPPHELYHRTSGPRLGPFHPGVLESWTMSDDGLVHTMKIREGLRWSDGHPVTTDDVAFRVEDELLNPDVTVVVPLWLRWAEPREEATTTVNIVDEYTFEIIFAEPNPGFSFDYGRRQEYWADILRPKHYLKQFHRDYAPWDELLPLMEAEGFADEDDWGAFYLEQTGSYYDAGSFITQSNVQEYPTLDPFVVVDIRPDGDWVLERNPYFYMVDPAGNQLPYIDGLRRQLRTDQEVVNMDIIAGNTDLQAWYTTIEDYPLFVQYADRGNYHVVPVQFPHDHLLIYAFNMSHKDEKVRSILSDLRFRQAMSIALDREQMVESIFMGFGTPSQFSPHPDSAYYEEGMTEYYAEYDPERAKALLDEIGLVDQTGSGWRDHPDGTEFTLRLDFFIVSPASIPGSEVAQRYWEDIGVRTQVTQIDGGYWGQLFGANEHMSTIWWAHGPNPTDTYWMGLHAPAQAWRSWYLSGGTTGIEPPDWAIEYLRTQDALHKAVDIDEWIALGKQLFRMQNEYLTFIGTVSGAKNPLIYSRDLANLNMELAQERNFVNSTILDASTQWFFQNEERR